VNYTRNKKYEKQVQIHVLETELIFTVKSLTLRNDCRLRVRGNVARKILGVKRRKGRQLNEQLHNLFSSTILLGGQNKEG